MMAASSDASKIHDKKQDFENDPNEAQNPESSTDAREAEKETDTNIHGSNNKGETTVSNTSSDPPAPERIDNAHTSSNPDESKVRADLDAVLHDTQNANPVESNSPINLDEVKSNDDDVRAPFDYLEPEETEKPNTTLSISETRRMNDSTPSDGRNEEKRKKNEDSSSDHDDRQTIHNSSNISNIDEPDRSSYSCISYSVGEPDLLESVFANTTDKNLINRLLGCAYGQALGDAYGLSTEFEDRVKVARNYPDETKLIPFPKYVSTWHNRRWDEGDWTDDTDQWILILDTLMFHDGDEKVFAKKLTNWIRCGYPELGDHGGMGLGANVSQVVHSHNYITNPLKASEAVWERGNRQAAPNGAVMRCSASAFVHFNDPKKVISTAILMCKTTHFDPRCIASCLAVCLAVTYLLKEKVDDNDIESLIKRVQDETIEILGDSFSEEHRKFFLWHTDKARTLEELELDEPSSIGYTYKCLASGFYGLRSTRSFEQTLNDLIRYGGDADTNGAVCGTMFGARYGYKALPFKWLRAMPNKKWLDTKIIECFKEMNLIENNAMETNL